jgi:hypothetical protein
VKDKYILLADLEVQLDAENDKDADAIPDEQCNQLGQADEFGLNLVDKDIKEVTAPPRSRNVDGGRIQRMTAWVHRLQCNRRFPNLFNQPLHCSQESPTHLLGCQLHISSTKTLRRNVP